MSDIEITLKLPSELIDRARAVGMSLEDELEAITEAVEKEIRRREAGKRLEAIAEELRALPDELKPTPQEIEAEIGDYWTEKTAQNKNTS